MEVSEKAVYNFVEDSYNCSEGIVAAISEEKGLPKDSLTSLASAFGGGIGSSGNICGALTGGLMMLGYLAKDNNVTKADLRAKSREVYEKFENEFKSVNCSALTNHVCASSNEPYNIKMCKPYIKFVVDEVMKMENKN